MPNNDPNIETTIQSDAMISNSRTNLYMSMFTAISRGSGFIRQMALVFALGLGALNSTYSSANETPNMVYELFIGGVLGIILLPEFIHNIETFSKEKADKKNSSIISLYLCLLFLIVVVGIIFAPYIFKLYSTLSPDNLKGDQQIVGTYLLRIFMPQIFFYGIAAMSTSMLNAKRKFIIPVVAPIINNIILISLYVFLYNMKSKPTLNNVIETNYLLILGLGTTLAVVLMSLVYIPALRSINYRFKFQNPFKAEFDKDLFKNTGWSLLYALANFVALIFVIVLANTKYSIYLLGWAFFQLPYAIFAAAIITSTAPTIVSEFIKNNIEKVQKIYSKSINSLLLGIGFLSVLLGTFSYQFIPLFLDRGAAESSNVKQVPNVLTGFLVGLVFFTIYMYGIKIILLRKKTKTALIINICENIFNIVLAMIFMKLFGIVGLSYAFSLAYVLGCFILWKKLRDEGIKFFIPFSSVQKATFWLVSLFILAVSFIFCQELSFIISDNKYARGLLSILFAILISCIFLSWWTKKLSVTKPKNIFKPKSWWHTLMQD